MPDYTPPYLRGALTLTASAAISGGDILRVSGNGTVAPIVPGATPVMNIIGVAASDTVVNGRVTVWGFGPVHESLADGTVTAGDQVTMAQNASRQVRTSTPPSTPATEPVAYAAANTVADLILARSVLGVALTTAADNTKVRWMQTNA
jgi:hypothetical protein